MSRSLEEQRVEFKNKKLIATPIAGLIAWLAVGVSGIFFSDFVSVWVLFIATGSIVYLGMGISKLTGENFLDREKPKNTFDTLFFFTVTQSILVYAIAIPFFLQDHTSLPLTVGILTGTMWLPITWIIGHWVGIFHSITRTIIVLAMWFVFPNHRFVAIPFTIVVLYAITIYILNDRYRKITMNKTL